MASLLTGESSHHQAPGLNFKVPQQKIEGVGGGWYLSRKEIEENSPSRKDGIDLKKETYLRKSFCTFLQDLGVKLKVPQVTIATAIVFCHRFFLRQSHAKNDRSIIALACMFLAGKVEETPRHLKDVILVSYEIIHQNDAAAVQRIKQKEVYEHKKELILLGERVVLGTLGFDLNVQHPYRPLVEAIKKFKVAKNALAQVAWNFINDGLRTSLCLQFLPRQIAAGAIFLAALCLKVKLPSDGDKAWWQDYGVTLRQLEEYSDQMLELYEQHTVPQFQVNEVEGSAQGGQPPSKAPADEEYVASYSSSHGGSTSKASSSKPAQSRPDCWGEDGISDLQHHGREAITRQGNSGETQNKTEFGVEGHGDDDQEGNCVRIKPRDAEGLKDKYHGRNLPDKDVTVGQPPQDAKIKLDRGKLKAAFERRKARGEMTREIDLMDELERELEDVEVPVDSEKSKRKRKQSWSKPSRPEHESSHHMKYSNEARDAHCQAIKGQSLHGDDFDTVEEGEVEQADEVGRVYQSPGSSRKRKSGNPLDWNGLGRLG